MKLELPGIAMAFDDLPIGSFFMFEQAKRKFGICVLDGQKRAAIILSTPERPDGRMPWLALGGLPQGVVVCFPTAILRANYSDIDNNIGQYGRLISAGGKVYMRVSDNMGGDRTFNVETGRLENWSEGEMAIAYANWRLGILTDTKFDPIFSFPANLT